MLVFRRGLRVSEIGILGPARRTASECEGGRLKLLLNALDFSAAGCGVGAV